MADLFALLSWSSASLAAHRASSATHSHNLQNSNTPGFARQRANLSATLPSDRFGGSFIGRGVGLRVISQARDGFVERQLPDALAASARSGAQASALEGLSALDPDGGAGLTNALSSFYSSLRQLSQSPGDSGSRQAFLGAARAVALTFNRAAQNVANARNGVDAQLAANARRASDLAQSLADLNRQVRVEVAAGTAPNDLLDARQRVQDELVSLTGAQVLTDAQGNVNLQLDGGALVNGDLAATLSTQVDATNGGHLGLALTPAGGTTSTLLAPTAMGGTMGGQLDARDGALRTAEANLDTLALDFANAVNTAHRAGFGLDGVGGRALFSVSATTNPARTIAVDAAMLADPRRLAAAGTAASTPGDASNLFSLIQTEGQALSNGLDVFDGLASAIATWGSQVDSARTSAERDGAVKTQLESLRESVSGVSIDEELVALTQAQRSFEAVMKVIKTTDQMLDTLMSLK
jgi:flagellar hook-associated protein 1 FlgK